jgi:hypothetical protein
VERRETFLTPSRGGLRPDPADGPGNLLFNLVPSPLTACYKLEGALRAGSWLALASVDLPFL